MQQIVDELSDPEDHLAVDEALLLEAEEGHASDALRVWEFSRHVVVAGRGTRVSQEIDRPFCESCRIPIFRRCSGGASVVAGPGCLMYSLVLGFEGHDALRRIDVAHQYVMSRVLRALRRQIPAAEYQGTCDLTWQDRKCSGNSLRIARRHLLYHGTILYDFDLTRMARCLKEAPRQPEYRQGRDHQSFTGNVPIDSERFSADLCAIFGAEGQIDAESLRGRIRQLRRQRYDDPAWHFRH
jgi:lipoate-protein ligase A